MQQAPSRGTPEWFARQENYLRRFEELVPALLTKDGLLPTEHIKVSNEGRLYLSSDPEVQVWPHWRIEGMMASALRMPDIWRSSAILVRPGRSVVGRLRIRGIPFELAARTVIEKREHRATFMVNGAVEGELNAVLLARLHRLKPHEKRPESKMALEAWQWPGEGSDAHYAHLELNEDATSVLHFDTAMVRFAHEDDVRSMVYTGKKAKGDWYQKFFRVDGDIDVGIAVGLLGLFFPVDTLVEEYFDPFQSRNGNDAAG